MHARSYGESAWLPWRAGCDFRTAAGCVSLPSAENMLPWPQMHSWSSCRPQGRGAAAAGGGHGWVRQQRPAGHCGLVLRLLVEPGRARNSGGEVAVRYEQARLVLRTTAAAAGSAGCGLAAGAAVPGKHEGRLAAAAAAPPH
ncbi:unnamed protein product [Coccothraustes coccothraustes]